MPGSGVCPGQTTGRGILDDAVALVRGDRFLSYDFNSSTLTHWGAALLEKTSPGSYGGSFPRLLFTGLPAAFPGTSPYSLVPFYTPQAAKGILEGNKAIGLYNLTRPASDNFIVSVQTQAGCKQVFEDRDSFRVMYQAPLHACTDGRDFMLGLDDATRHDTRSTALHKIFFEENFEANITAFFSQHVARLIKENSLEFLKGRKQVDIVRDVVNITPILWLSERFAIPLKTAKTPRGLLTIHEASTAFNAMQLYQSFNVLPHKEWMLRDSATKASVPLRGIFEAHLKTQAGGMKEKIADYVEKGSVFEVGPRADKFYKDMRATNMPIEDCVADCIGLATPIASNLTQQASLLIDLFLSPGYEQYKARIVELAHMDATSSERELQGFVMEGMRHAGVVPGVPRIAAQDITIEDGARGPVHVKAGHTVIIGTSKAAMDPLAFPEPEKLNPTRDFKDYTVLGYGMHACFGARMVATSMAATLREVFKLKNVRRADGRHGKFAITEHELAGIKIRSYLDSSSRESPVPTSLTLTYDD